ncbi:MAG: MFS transporter [Sphaerochaetaceae bacterium]|nr:MFS transporter [Sphaerochaetaceae bacterium]
MNGKKYGFNTVATLTALLITYFLSAFVKISASVVIPIYQEKLGFTSSLAGFISSMYYMPYAFMQLLTGPLCRKFGPQGVVASGLLLCAAGGVMFGFPSNLYLVIVGRFLMGLGMGVSFISVVSFIQNNFDGRFYGKLMGFSIMICNFGSACSSEPLRALLKIVSERTVFICLSAIMVVLALSLLILGRKDCRRNPEEIGASDSLMAQIADSMKIVIHNRYVLCGLLLWVCYNAVLMAYQGLWCVKWTEIIFSGTGYSYGLSGTLIAVGVMIGCVISDNIRFPKNSYAVSVWNVCLANILLFFVAILYRKFGSSFFVLLVIDTLYGISTGHICVQETAMVRERTDAVHNATIMGILNFFANLCSQNVQWLTGVMIDRFGSVSENIADSFFLTFSVLEFVFIVVFLFTGSLRKAVDSSDLR